MRHGLCITLALAPRTEGWLWWCVLVACVVVVLLLLGMVRRWLVRPMPHKPSDTTDAWAEAGRRLPVPPATPEKDTPGREDPS